MKFLITGGCGFLGSNISEAVIQRKDTLVVFDNLSRVGSGDNLLWLQQKGPFTFINGDARNQDEVESVIRDERPDVVIHLAGQVAMTTSIEDPRKDFEINALGSFNILDSIRKYSPESILIYSSTNKVYGDLEWVTYEEGKKRYTAPEFPNGFAEDIPLQFSSPYGCSKGAADQYLTDAYKVFGIKTIVLRHSSMFGGRQFSTFDQGWIGWFCDQAIQQKKAALKEPFTISGNGKQVRDVLFASDMVGLYFSLIEHIESTKGQCFNIGGGFNNSLSLLELFDILEKELDSTLNYTQIEARHSDQKIFIADISKVKKFTGWEPKVNKVEGVKKMLEWVQNK
ncbi:MAG: CDP-paratose 2-epimerase [Parcubacteria group bacterium Gr01-1014_56]|nr:MAG: CDP-paratose 2-epimerase [Parcubacteria group bacterium Gr01-1014_56]